MTITGPSSLHRTGRRNRRFDETEISAKLELAVTWRAENLPIHEIARRLGVSDTTLYNWQNRRKKSQPVEPNGEITALRLEIARLREHIKRTADHPPLKNEKSKL